jgi:biopolymer transport protein ExbD
LGRKHRRHAEPPVDVTLPITPMLDMSFQLLSFFILTFKPMPTEGQLAVNLPKVDAAQQVETDPSPPDETKKDEYIVTLISGASGEVANISMKGPTAEMGNIRNFADLYDQLKKLAKSSPKGPEGISITVEASNDLVYGRLIEVMDMCKKAGYESVNLQPVKSW